MGVVTQLRAATDDADSPASQNVFPTDEAAARLYGRQGFAVTSQVMRKTVD